MWLVQLQAKIIAEKYRVLENASYVKLRFCVYYMVRMSVYIIRTRNEVEDAFLQQKSEFY
ncbi:hypothetical protein PsorP6_000336 [Peronosclerospora sorghi]|uniref:Uncharacterized protein n=1 Tax=Peronosclerospora sorghi TaxID=230839 RepID=A0ACC0WTN2_9STRA|nr:hypothetical protein PsorP6_000336 [Peronosclerospora sorghi]